MDLTIKLCAEIVNITMLNQNQKMLGIEKQFKITVFEKKLLLKYAGKTNSVGGHNMFILFIYKFITYT